jgi:predicted ATPase
MLLVVDNCEHVLDEVAEQIDDLLGGCPHLRILATSREALDVEGEHVMRVQSLGVAPDAGESPALRLFVERAADAGTDLDPSDDAVIVDICRRLDGLPLAIELAAARCGVLSPTQILDRLDDRFTLLTGGHRRSRGRQQTLETAIAWSYDLLDANDQEVLCRLSVMPASFDLELAAAVVDRPSAATLDALDTLAARSLVYTERDERARALRYRLLETIRAYAFQRLLDAGDAEATRGRHAVYVADRLDAIPDMPMSMQPEHADLADDAIAAIEWARASNKIALGARLACGATPVFIGRGMLDRGEEFQGWAAEVDDPILRSKVFICQCVLQVAAGTRAGGFADMADLSLSAAGERSVPWRARAHSVRALALLLFDQTAAERELELGYEALAEPDAIEVDRFMLDLWAATIDLWRRDFPAAVKATERFQGLWSGSALPDMNLAACCLLVPMLAGDRAAVEHQLADPATNERRALWLESAGRGEHWLLSYEAVRGAALGFLGDHAQGRIDLVDALALLTTQRMHGVEADFLGALAWICLQCGEPGRAEELLRDTWELARSPNTIILLMEAFERSNGLTARTVAERGHELWRRIEMRDVVIREDRTRRALDSEVERLGLT